MFSSFNLKHVSLKMILITKTIVYQFQEPISHNKVSMATCTSFKVVYCLSIYFNQKPFSHWLEFCLTKLNKLCVCE